MTPLDDSFSTFPSYFHSDCLILLLLPGCEGFSLVSKPFSVGCADSLPLVQVVAFLLNIAPSSACDSRALPIFPAFVAGVDILVST